MKIFSGFLKRKSKMVAFGIVVVVLLASVVGVVSGYESGGGCIPYLYAEPDSITADGKSTTTIYFKVTCPGKCGLSLVPNIGVLKVDTLFVEDKPMEATYTAPTTQELGDYKEVTLTITHRDSGESKSVTISLVPDCEIYCKEKFDKEQPASLMFIEGKGEHPFCYCICMDEKTGEEVICWEEDWDCENYCSEMYKNKQWDSISEWPYCQCICKQGYEEREKEGCVPCKDICKKKGGEHYIEDKEKSEQNSCACKCEDGYDDSYSEKCEKVECPPNSTNVAELGGSCPKDREKLNRHCCCDAGYVKWYGICIKEEDVPGKDGEGKVEKTAIEKERERLENEYGGLKKGHVLYRQGKLSAYSGDEWGHVGLYIGDFKAEREYTVRDVPRLEVFRDGKFILLRNGQTIKKGDMIIGAVIEILESGAVLNTVEGFESMITPKPFGKGKDMDWRTTKIPPTDAELETIINTAVNKLNKSEEGKLHWDLGEKSSIDWISGDEEFDCVSFVEYCFEKARLNPTPDHLEGGSWTDWFLRPDEQYKNMVSPPKGKNVYISVKSPVNLHLYDSMGRHVGVNPQGIVEREIPDAYYQPEVEGYPQGIKITDVKDVYSLVIDALDEGSFNLRILDRNVCTPGSMTEVDFQEVLITKGTEACLDVGSAGNEYLMSIDENGDGTVDQTLEPTSLATTPWTPETSQETEGLTFESNSKPSGSSVQIPLTLNGIEDKIGNIDITLSYDPSVLEATEVTKGDLTTDSLFEYNIMAGTILISLADAEGFSGNGTIAYVTFNVTGVADSTSPLQIAALAANRAEDYEVLTIPTNDGVFRVIFISTEERGGLTVSVSDTTGAKGSTVEVSINLEGATEVGSMDIVLNYDANVLSAVDVEAGALGKNVLTESNTAKEGAVIIALADSSGIDGDGTVASVAFEVIGDAGTTSYLTLEEVLVHNIDLGEIIPNTVNGTFLVI